MDEETQKIIDLAKQAADEMQYEYARAQAAIAQAQAMTVIAEALTKLATTARPEQGRLIIGGPVFTSDDGY